MSVAFDRYDWCQRGFPIPPDIPTDMLLVNRDSPYVPTIRPPPGVALAAWIPASTLLGYNQYGVQSTYYNPCQPLLYSYITPSYMPAPGDTPVWPTPLVPLVGSPLINARMLPALWEPGTFPAEPFGTPVPLRLHPHLIYNPISPTVPMLQWDIIHRAEQARVLTGRQVIVPLDLNAEAMLPNIRKIWISSDHPVLAIWMQSWGPIMIEKSNISICDVLDAIYNYFQQPLTLQDLQRIRKSLQNAASLTFAAHQRAGDSHDLCPVSLASGFRRADVMGSHRRFQGLRPVVYQDNTWKLFLGLLPGPVLHVS